MAFAVLGALDFPINLREMISSIAPMNLARRALVWLPQAVRVRVQVQRLATMAIRSSVEC